MGSKLPPSAVALASFLDEHGSAPFKGVVHRTALWTYKVGKRKPDNKTATLIEKITEGSVAANGWYLQSELKGAA